MSVKDWGSLNRWLIGYVPNEVRPWRVCPPFIRPDARWLTRFYPTFSEAHAAYLDAVTCEEVTPFLNYSDPRCGRSRGHKGPHWFATPLGLMPLVVNQK